jgi:hypothetical protein
MTATTRETLTIALALTALLAAFLVGASRL